MRKIGSVPIFLIWASPALAQMHECTLNPHDAQAVAQVAADGTALELRKGAEGCRLQLDCKARAAPARLRYDLATLQGLKTAPVASQITRIIFQYADGELQVCHVVGARALN